MKISRLYNFTKEELQSALDKSTGYTSALKILGIGGSSSIKTLLKVIDEYNLSTEILEKNRELSRLKGVRINEISLKDILIENSTYTNTDRLKLRLIKNGLKENICECCGIIEWNGKPIKMQLHHINGKHNDNRIENLQILCPNCHSQTDNFSKQYSARINDKNQSVEDLICPICHKKKSAKSKLCRTCNNKNKITNLDISRETLKNEIRNFKFTHIGEKYGVSDNTIRKWCKKYNLPYKSKDIKSYSDEEWKLI